MGGWRGGWVGGGEWLGAWEEGGRELKAGMRQVSDNERDMEVLLGGVTYEQQDGEGHDVD